jgi:hypothetical protein
MLYRHLQTFSSLSGKSRPPQMIQSFPLFRMRFFSLRSCHLHGLRRPPDRTTADSLARVIFDSFLAGFSPQTNAIATRTFNPPLRTCSNGREMSVKSIG